jgi:hypothetical protein
MIEIKHARIFASSSLDQLLVLWDTVRFGVINKVIEMGSWGSAHSLAYSPSE